MRDCVETLKTVMDRPELNKGGTIMATVGEAIHAVLERNEGQRQVSIARGEEIERLQERVSDLECVSGLKEVLGEGCEHKARLAAVLNFLTPPPEGSTDLIWWKPETSGLTPWILPKILKILQGEKPNGD